MKTFGAVGSGSGVGMAFLQEDRGDVNRRARLLARSGSRLRDAVEWGSGALTPRCNAKVRLGRFRPGLRAAGLRGRGARKARAIPSPSPLCSSAGSIGASMSPRSVYPSMNRNGTFLSGTPGPWSVTAMVTIARNPGTSCRVAEFDGEPPLGVPHVGGHDTLGVLQDERQGPVEDRGVAPDGEAVFELDHLDHEGRLPILLPLLDHADQMSLHVADGRSGLQAFDLFLGLRHAGHGVDQVGMRPADLGDGAPVVDLGRALVGQIGRQRPELLVKGAEVVLDHGSVSEERPPRSSLHRGGTLAGRRPRRGPARRSPPLTRAWSLRAGWPGRRYPARWASGSGARPRSCSNRAERSRWCGTQQAGVAAVEGQISSSPRSSGR